MMKSDRTKRRLLGKLVRFDEIHGRRKRDENYIDLTRPSVLLLLTIIYVVIVGFLVLGAPWPGLEMEPIPPEQLPVAIPGFIALYVVVIGGFYLRDKFRK